ncbi:hypothetical protein [Polaromonas sp. JS666]|uniref:hypothetical protein n=1 Tax=Polaromonas sp. (strain JS666 / ATCC BAA-500) TaxID=296591 RepID=UPI001E410853|nr:hypothetical protein [Polaromonas sp. JS666]
MKFRSILALSALSAVVVLSTGCASQLLSDERLTNNTAQTLGVPAGDVTVSNRQEQGTNTTYTAKTRAGVEYSCSVNGGGILAAGMVQGAQCAKKGEALKPNRPFGK